MLELEAKPWTITDAKEAYDISRWGNGYFGINELGHVTVHPDKNPERAIDLKQLVDQLQLRSIDLPILIRFAEILKHRLGEMSAVFQNAIQEHKYQGNYCCVYPIKVNQQRQVVEEVIQFGKPYKFGVEAGSKPELLAVIAMTTTLLRLSATDLKMPSSSKRRCSRTKSVGPLFRSSKNIPNLA